MNRTMSLLQMDLRALEAPEPAERILECLETLQPGQRLVALTPMYPVHLLPIVEAWGFTYEISDCDDGGARIVISRASERPLPDPTARA
ncbi:DUF2249 domain-containing protein [Pseudoxanthomonas sangjuensis]|uniref:DUF2249 domain-containing protein n=1 Tax=Pseudoxanthomonas sangjuensis TaxID=1503750 RepID=UPI0013916BE4|nr:DUF2249 domain-containing protein [Pseudoxanthomonas sangjuensis]